MHLSLEPLFKSWRFFPAYMLYPFQLPHFYVEPFYFQETKEIRKYRVFYSTKHLTPYPETISLDNSLITDLLKFPVPILKVTEQRVFFAPWFLCAK